MKIAFFGTPAFAVPVLKTLITSGHEIILVVSQPDRPKGRSMETCPTPVKQAAIDAGLNILQPEKCANRSFLDEYKTYTPDINIIVAFGQILPEELIYHPKFASVNIHASLLPKYRGASPINWALINGDEETGITYQFIDKGLDTGDVIYQEKLKIEKDDDAPSLFEKLSDLSAGSVLKVIKLIEEDKAVRIKQDNEAASVVKTLKKELGRLDFNAPAVSIVNKIRGLVPWPSAYCAFKGKTLKIHSAETIDIPANVSPGTIVEAVKSKGIAVKTADGCVLLKVVQPESGKKMNAWDFSLGHKDIIGTKLA